LGVAGGVLAHDACGAVGGTVVDDEGFPARRELWDRRDSFIEEIPDVGLLVVDGKEA
jgi:hypothetical protein